MKLVSAVSVDEIVSAYTEADAIVVPSLMPNKARPKQRATGFRVLNAISVDTSMTSMSTLYIASSIKPFPTNAYSDGKIASKIKPMANEGRMGL